MVFVEDGSDDSNNYNDYNTSEENEDEDNDDEESDDSRSQSKTEATEEISLTPEDTVESTEELDSGPDSSPPNLSDSTDESSASKAISGGSSEISYTMSSSAEDAFPTFSSEMDRSKKKQEDISYTMSSSASVYSSSEEDITHYKFETDESSIKKEKDVHHPHNTSTASNYNGISKNASKAVNKPILASNVLTKNKRKLTASNGKFDNIAGAKKKAKINKTKEKAKKYERIMTNSKLHVKTLEGDDSKPNMQAGFTTARTVRMIRKSMISQNLLKVDQSKIGTPSKRGDLDASKESPHLDMLKVKKAEIDSKKKAKLEHELLKDYPENETVEIVNWEGTFAPIHGEPYVAPLHHQPDSFWDAIYRSTDPDLPTPPGADVEAIFQTTGSPSQSTIHKDQVPLHQSSPKVQSNHLYTNAHADGYSLFAHHEGLSVIHPNAVHKPPALAHPFDGSKSFYFEEQTNYKAKNKDKGKKEKKKPKLSPKEKKKKKKDKLEEKESNPGNNFARPPGKIKVSGQGDAEDDMSTTYKPEGAYEYPSFRHPDFNPDTAYDENGIPIHESPGWTPPPTLPGDHRFGRERRPDRTGASLLTPLIHQAQVVKNVGYHKISKRKVSESGEPHSTSSIMSTKELNMAAAHHRKQLVSKEYRAYSAYPDSEETVVLADENPIETYEQRKTVIHARPTHRVPQDPTTFSFPFRVKKPGSKLSDSELLEKEDSAPLEAFNPALYMHRNMFRARKRNNNKRPNINENTEVVAVIVGPNDAQNQMVRLGKLGELRTHASKKEKKKPENTPVLPSHINNEALNPLLYKHRNMFKVSNIVDDGTKISKDLVNSANRNKQMDMTKTIPLDEYLKGNPLKGRGRENFNPFFINNNKIFQVKTNKFKHISEEHIIAKRQTNKEIAQTNTRNKLELAGGTPGAGRPKNLRRKTKDDEDSFASYFEGMDPDVVEEEEESTTTPGTTTMSFIEIDPSEFMPRKSNRTYQRGVRHTPSTQPPEPKHYSWNKDFLSREHLPFYVGNQVPDPGLRRPHLLQDSSLFHVDEIKKAGQEEHIIKTRAQLLQKLTEKLRPMWRKELEELNLDPDNTTIEFTNSMQVEVSNYLRSHLLTGSPGDDTLNTLTDEVYKIARERQKGNKSVGHILMGVPPKRDPLLCGTVHVKEGGFGEYHLQYRPLGKPGYTQEMNGTISLHDLRLNITHRNAATKLLRKILTVRPRDLTYSQADNVLSKIFSSGVKNNHITHTVVTRRKPEKVVSIIEVSVTTSKYSDAETVSEPSASKPTAFEAKGAPLFTTVSHRITSKSPYNSNAVKEEISLLESINESVAPPKIAAAKISSTQSSFFEEFNKLRETITMGRNISSILMEEMEVRQRETNKLQNQMGNNQSEDKIATVGSWKLQQRIRDFKPGRSYPTMPPFVRKWPTFRLNPKIVTLTSESDNLPTLFTMRPKYKGPRHEPFFFDDFKRIRTVYPSTLPTAQVFHSTDVSTKNSRLETKIDELVGLWKVTATPESELVQRTDNIKSIDDTMLSASNIPHTALTERRFSSEILDKNKYKNELPNNRMYDSFKKTDYHMSTPFPLSSEHNDARTIEPRLIKQRTSIKSTKPYFVTLKVAGKIHTVRPIFIRTTRVPTTIHSPSPRITTTMKTPFNAFKHHIKRGLNKLFSVFGIGKSKKE